MSKVSKYRDPSMNPATLRSIEITGEAGYHTMRLCTIKVRDLSKEEYAKWVAEWKLVYKNIAEMSRGVQKLVNEVGQSEVHAARHHLRILSNTLLNARQYARDARRSLYAKV